jgi:hypothetical protein
VARLVTVAQNQEVVQDATFLGNHILSDPIEMGRFDRVNVMWTVHYLWAFGGGGPTAEARYAAGMSNDGVHWTPVIGLIDSTTSPTGSTPRQLVVLVPAAFVRFRMNVIPTGTAVLGGASHDLLARLDHA